VRLCPFQRLGLHGFDLRLNLLEVGGDGLGRGGGGQAPGVGLVLQLGAQLLERGKMR
jgi:hypothetical protein